MSMRLIGNVLLWAGVVVGALSGVWLWFGPSAGGMPLLVGVGLIKLTFVAGLALIATGAVALRMDNRARLRQLLDGADPDVVITADRRTARKESHGLRREHRALPAQGSMTGRYITCPAGVCRLSIRPRPR